ncbi:MAG: response regulator [Myxococcota bacterium]|nr:response regulator [Myxococcota bacterium]
MSTKKVLIVDDSVISRMFMRRAVQGSYADWEVIEASNGQEALVKLAQVEVDVAFLDLNMPGGINGLSLAKTLKAKSSSVRIALVTANIQSAVREKAEELGIEFIPKPITDEKIINFLREADRDGH